MTDRVWCTVPQGLLGLPLGAGGKLIDLLPPSSLDVPSGGSNSGIMLNNFLPANISGFQVSVDGTAWAAFLNTPNGKFLTAANPSPVAPLIAMN
jgi:hypothetical protein